MEQLETAEAPTVELLKLLAFAVELLVSVAALTVRPLRSAKLVAEWLESAALLVIVLARRGRQTARSRGGRRRRAVATGRRG